MSIPNNVYPNDYFGSIGKVECNRCGTSLSEEVDAIYDEVDDQYYCELCYPDVVEEREEEE